MRDLHHLDALEVRFAVDGDEGRFTGYASIFDAFVPGYREIVKPGAFAKSLAEHRAADTMPSMLFAHDDREIVGLWTGMDEDARGLRVSGELVLETSRGREMLALLKRKALNGLSIGFTAIRDTRDAKGVRIIHEARLHEVSLVAMPASAQARVLSVRQAADTRAARLAAFAASTRAAAATLARKNAR